MDIGATNLRQAPPAPRRDYLFLKKPFNFPGRRGLEFPLGVLRDETRGDRFDKVQASRDQRGGPGGLFLGARISARGDLPKVFAGKLAGGLQVDGRAGANRPLAKTSVEAIPV